MIKYIFIISLLFGGTSAAAAQETYVFKGESKNYDVKARVEKCNADENPKTCDSKAVFYVLKKNRARVLQTIEMNDTHLSISDEQQQKKGDVTELYGDRHGGVYFTDYNFDGFEDLALSNGYNLPYGGTSYDVFLYSKTTGKFVRNAALSELESEKILVEINKKLKIIETQTKSGCCWHEKARYRFVNNRLQKFYVFTEDSILDPKWVVITTERLVNGRWLTTTKRILTEKYYNE